MAGRIRRGVLSVLKINYSIVGELKMAIEVAAHKVGIPPSQMLEQIILTWIDRPTNLSEAEIVKARGAALGEYDRITRGKS